MNEEEKQAIEYWKTHIEILHCNTQIASEHYIKVLLDLVEKQQKEIELMKTKINKIVLMIKENYNSDFYDDYETIAGLRDDIYNLLMKNNIGE